MKRIFIILLTLLSLVSCSNENNTFVFGIEELESIKDKEFELGSELYADTIVFTSSNLPEHLREKSDNQALFLRNKNAVLPLKTKQYYNSKDQKVYCTVYQWDRVVPGMTNQVTDSLLTIDVNNQAMYDDKFNEIGELIIDQFGMPNKGNGNLVPDKFKMLAIWKRHLVWDLEDEYIELNMFWVPKTGYRIFKVFLVHYKKG